MGNLSQFEKHKATQRSEKSQNSNRARRITLTIILCLLAVAVMVTCTQCKKIVDAESAAKAATEAESATEAPTEYNPLDFKTPQIPDNGTTEGYYSSINTGVYIYDNMAFEISGANDEAAQDYAAAISEFKKSAPDFTVYNTVVPIHAEFGIPKRVIDSGVYSASQSENIKKIYSSYTEDVKPINCYNALAEHSSEYLYFNTDHHWTGLGAYYAYQAFCEQTDQTALELSACTENKIEGFTGSLNDCANSLKADSISYWTLPYETHAVRQEGTDSDPYETGLYSEGFGEGPNGYLTFIGGDSALFIEYNDTTKNGKKIAVVKESYGNAFVPYLTYNYEEVHVIDSRYFGSSLKSYMEENGINEVLFINNIMSANNPFHVDGMREIF